MRYVCVLAAPALLLSGCTTFSGSPEPVITVAQAQAMIHNLEPDSVLLAMAQLPTEGERNSYRNRVVATYLMAADARYDQFRRDISKNAKGGNVAFDLATLGLTGLAATWKNAATSLATGANVVAGARASLNRELYFEKTLPALLSLMDSSRLTVRADILKGLSEPENVYSMEEAFGDIWRYQSAASIDGAIQQAAAAAAEEADEAKIDYSKAVQLCRVSNDIGATRRSIMFALEGLKKGANDPTNAQAAIDNRTKIRDVAKEAGVADAQIATDAQTTQTQVSAIASYLRSLCTEQNVAAFRDKVTAKGVTIP